jgi:hypothetical protein
MKIALWLFLGMCICDGKLAVITNWNPCGFQEGRRLYVRKSTIDVICTIKYKRRRFLAHDVSLY